MTYKLGPIPKGLPEGTKNVSISEKGLQSADAASHTTNPTYQTQQPGLAQRQPEFDQAREQEKSSDSTLSEYNPTMLLNGESRLTEEVEQPSRAGNRDVRVQQGPPVASFLTFTSVKDMKSAETRAAVRARVSRFAGRKKKAQLKLGPDTVLQSFVAWRMGTAEVSHEDPKSLVRRKSIRDLELQQALSEIGRVIDDIPASLFTSMSLLQCKYILASMLVTLRNHLLIKAPIVFQTNPFLYWPAQMMLDAGNPSAMAFFPSVDLRDVYHAVMGMLLSWLASQFPSQYPLDAALYHQAQSIPLIRERLSGRMLNEATFLSILCAMQTDVCPNTKRINIASLTDLGTPGQ
jgi:hypothetical protein